MKKVLVVCGPTATGKTKLALHIARKFDGEIISADSRQVYKFFDVVTGKSDYFNSEIKTWGIDIVNPAKNFSAKLYSDYAREKIEDICSRNKVPIIEGGTGFYIDATLKNFENINVPRNQKLRESYKDLDAQKLFVRYMKHAPVKAIALNDSDKKNKRRLIRLLEIADFESQSVSHKNYQDKSSYDVLWIGLNYESREKLYNQIDKRVEDRLGRKLEEEIEFLKEKGFFEKAQETTPGYKYWDSPEKWKTAEHQYAKRQLTWFKRNKNINWLVADSGDLQSQVEDIVSKWYS